MNKLWEDQCAFSAYFCRGIVLKDLIAVDGQAKDYLDKEHTLINMSKYQKLCAHLTRIRQYQVTAPAFPPRHWVHDHPASSCHTEPNVRRRFRWTITGVWLGSVHSLCVCSLSSFFLQTREPPVHNPSSPTRRENRLPKFSAWVSGSMPQLDASTLKKHVAKMVDVSLQSCVCSVVYFFRSSLFSKHMTQTNQGTSVLMSSRAFRQTFHL